MCVHVPLSGGFYLLMPCAIDAEVGKGFQADGGCVRVEAEGFSIVVEGLGFVAFLVVEAPEAEEDICVHG